MPNTPASLAELAAALGEGSRYHRQRAYAASDAHTVGYEVAYADALADTRATVLAMIADEAAADRLAELHDAHAARRGTFGQGPALERNPDGRGYRTAR